MKTNTYAKASETPKLHFLRISYTFPTVTHGVGKGVGNVGNLYSFLRSYTPRSVAALGCQK